MSIREDATITDSEMLDYSLNILGYKKEIFRNVYKFADKSSEFDTNIKMDKEDVIGMVNKQLSGEDVEVFNWRIIHEKDIDDNSYEQTLVIKLKRDSK